MIGGHRCDPAALSEHVFVASYYFRLASFVLAGGERQRFGLCYAVKTRRGWDGDRWREPAIFGGDQHFYASCVRVHRMDAPSSECLPMELASCTVAV